MTHIGTDVLKSSGCLTPGVARVPDVRDASPASWDAPGPADDAAASVSPWPAPAPPTPPIDARTVQAMASFEAEIGEMCTSWTRWAAAQDGVNADLVRQSGAAASGSFSSSIDEIHDGGMHYFMRLCLQDAQGGAAHLRRLARGAVAAQAKHLDAQQAHAEAAEAAAAKMKPLLAKAHIVSMAAHTLAMAAGCVVGVALGVGAAAPMSVLGAACLTLGVAWAAVAGGRSMFGGQPSHNLRQAAATLDIAAMAGLLMMTASQANPWLAPMLLGTRLVDGVAAMATQMLESHQESSIREAQALARLAREMGSVHERGYVSCMDVVQRLTQSHARNLGIINAMLRSNQQVNNLQIRNLRK